VATLSDTYGNQYDGSYLIEYIGVVNGNHTWQGNVGSYTVQFFCDGNSWWWREFSPSPFDTLLDADCSTLDFTGQTDSSQFSPGGYFVHITP
jgi:hypothetical protein